jgi:hypothetical protein
MAAQDLPDHRPDPGPGPAAPPGSWRGRAPLSLRLGNPAGVFVVLARYLRPLAPVRFLVLPAAAFATTAAGFNWLMLQTHLAQVGLTMGFVQSFLLWLILTNVMAVVLQGIVMAAHKAHCDEFGIQLAFGVIPKFYIHKGAIRALDPRGQRSCYGATLLFRLGVYALGVLVWITLLPTGSGLADYALAGGMAGLSSFLFTANPLLPADGYRWLAARLERPKLRVHGLRLLGMVLTFRPRREFWLLFLFALGSVAFTAFILVSVAYSVALVLEAELRGTGVVIFCLLLAALATYLVAIWEKTSGQSPRTGRRPPAR